MDEDEQRAADEQAAAEAKAAEEAAAADAGGGEGGAEETPEELKARADAAEAKAAKAEEVAANQKARAEKAEKAAKVAKTETGDLSTSDLYSLMNAKVHEDDVAQVKEYATLKGVSIAEALKAPLLQGILADSVEKRKTAEAAHSGPARRQANAPSEEAIVAEAGKGNLPDDPSKLAEARMALRQKDRKDRN